MGEEGLSKQALLRAKVKALPHPLAIAMSRAASGGEQRALPRRYAVLRQEDGLRGDAGVIVCSRALKSMSSCCDTVENNEHNIVEKETSSSILSSKSKNGHLSPPIRARSVSPIPRGDSIPLSSLYRGLKPPPPPRVEARRLRRDADPGTLAGFAASTFQAEKHGFCDLYRSLTEPLFNPEEEERQARLRVGRPVKVGGGGELEKLADFGLAPAQPAAQRGDSTMSLDQPLASPTGSFSFNTPGEEEARERSLLTAGLGRLSEGDEDSLSEGSLGADDIAVENKAVEYVLSGEDEGEEAEEEESNGFTVVGRRRSSAGPKVVCMDHDLDEDFSVGLKGLKQNYRLVRKEFGTRSVEAVKAAERVAVFLQDCRKWGMAASYWQRVSTGERLLFVQLAAQVERRLMGEQRRKVRRLELAQQRGERHGNGNHGNNNLQILPVVGPTARERGLRALQDSLHTAFALAQSRIDGRLALAINGVEKENRRLDRYERSMGL